jgi:carbonic anhydrase
MKKKLLYPALPACFGLLLMACSNQATEKNDPVEREMTQQENREEVADWSYGGESGPEHWGNLNPSYSACLDGSEQSPINIEFSQAAPSEKVENLQIQYEAAPFSLVHNGHTIQVNAPEQQNSIIVDGEEFTLAQFHFHTPSEHQFNGQHFDMELHLVHQDTIGRLAVLGVMIQEGEANQSLASVWNALPKEETEEEVKLAEPINLQQILPENQSSFQYSGSLTTPPCSEEVKWIVFEEPIQMSKEQIKSFQEIFEENHRPVQPLNEREIIKN